MANLQNNIIRDLAAQGSQPHVMKVEWDTYAANSKSVPYAARKINAWLNERLQKWDVMLVGHSRGGIFVSDLARQMSSQNIATLQQFLLDPTASIAQGDAYPTGVATRVNRAVLYDDGLPFLASFMVKDGLAVPGSEYRRVTVPGMGPLDTGGSHTGLANYFASTLYKDDLAKLLQGNPSVASRPFKREQVDVLDDKLQRVVCYETIKCPMQRKGPIVNVTGDYRDGTARGNVTILGSGGVDIMIGKAGIGVSAGVVGFGKFGAAITDKGATITVTDPTGMASGGLIVSRDQTRLDVNVAGVQISIGGPGAGVYVGGSKISVDRDVKLPAGTLKWQQKLPDGSTSADTIKGGLKVLSERRDTLGNYVTQRWDALGTTIERGNALGKTLLEERDKAGKVLSQASLQAGKWVKDKLLDGVVIQTETFAGAFGSAIEKMELFTPSHVLSGIKEFSAKGVMLREQFLDSGLGQWTDRKFDDLGNKLLEVLHFGTNPSDKLAKVLHWDPSGNLTSSIENTLVGNEVKRVAQQFMDKGKWFEQRLVNEKVTEQVIHFGDRFSQVFETASWDSSGVNTTLNRWKSDGKKELEAVRDSLGHWVQTTFDVHGNPIKDVYDAAGHLIENLSDSAGHAVQVISDTWHHWIGS